MHPTLPVSCSGDQIRAKLEAVPCIMDPLQGISFTDEPACNWCESCLAHYKETYEVGRKVAWEKLPEVFGLPSWEELRKREDEWTGTSTNTPGQS